MLSLAGGLAAPFLLRKWLWPVSLVIAFAGAFGALTIQHRAIKNQRAEIARLAGVERKFEGLARDLAAADDARRALEQRVIAADRLIAERLLAVDERNQSGKQGVKNALQNRAAGGPGGDSGDLLRELAQIQQSDNRSAGSSGVPNADRASAERAGGGGPL